MRLRELSEIIAQPQSSFSPDVERESGIASGLECGLGERRRTRARAHAEKRQKSRPVTQHMSTLPNGRLKDARAGTR